MAGVVLETLSWKKLIILGVSLLVLLITFFLIGGKIGNVLFANKIVDFIASINLTSIYFHKKLVHACDTSLIIRETPGNEWQNLSKMYHFFTKIQNLPEMNQEFSYIYYTFFKKSP